MKWSALPPLPALRSFAAFAQTGGVQQAGAALNVSHAAISQQIKALEAHLGLRLVDRSARALTLTPEGTLLAEALARGFDAIFQAVQELTGAEADRPLHITTTTAFAASWLMPRLPSFRAKHAEFDLVLAPDAALVNPQVGGLDLAIRYGDGQWDGFDTELLMHSPVVGVAAPALVGQNPPTDPAQLAHFPWLQDFGTHEGTKWLEAHGLKPDGGYVTAPGNLTLDAVRGGQGIAIVARVSVAAELASGQLVELFEQSSDSGYWLVTRHGVKRPALKAFMQWLRREARD